ncbi:hypothetical protein [Paenibacillus tundrae]|uniref:hypothetical protein n=1 Tax=Paenibacillus tundrae TaxID=528187 RepID=UPI0030CE71B7
MDNEKGTSRDSEVVKRSGFKQLELPLGDIKPVRRYSTKGSNNSSITGVDVSKGSESKDLAGSKPSAPKRIEGKTPLRDKDEVTVSPQTNVDEKASLQIEENFKSLTSQQKSNSTSPKRSSSYRKNAPPTPRNKQPAELDMELKISFKKILWNMGYYGRIDVKMASFGEYENVGRRDGIGEITDIDVWGFSIQEDFQISNLIVDCKNGENVSPSNRIFWLKGIMEHVGNSKGYMVMGKKVIPTNLREIGDRFNISLMDGKNITALERIYSIDLIENTEIFSEENFHKQERISEKSINELLDYRKYHYWMDGDHTKIHNTLNLLTKYSEKLYPTNKNHQMLSIDFAILLTIAIFNLCSYIMRTSLSDVRTGALIFLYDGVYNLDKYKSVLELVNNIFKSTVNNYEELKQFLDFKPSFFESLVELCITILRRPRESKDLLRYMDVVMYSVIMPKKEDKKSIKDVFGDDYNEITVKLMFDIFDFIQENTGLNKMMFPRNIIMGINES